MQNPVRPSIRIGSGADLAFAVIVLVSLFSVASNFQTVSAVEITLMISAGTMYILLGIYGYSYCVRNPNLRLHLAYFTVQTILGGLIVYLGHGASFNALILLPLVGHSVMLLSTRWTYGVNAVITCVFILTTGLGTHWLGMGDALPGFLAGQIFVIFFTQMAVNEEKARMEVEQLLSELGEANLRLREYAIQVEELTLTKERNRLAREIHDGLGHYLTTIHVQIQAALAVMSANPKQARETLILAQRQAQEALVDVRKSVSELRTGPDDGLPLPDKIIRLVEALRPAGIETKFEVAGKPHKVTPQTELTLYRTAQEALNNVRKHSRAAHTWVRLDFRPSGWINLSIRDDGAGCEGDNEGGFGLLGIRERVHLLNGQMKITSARGQGFELEIEVPG
ncbi:MAG TPA: sensor histidine kinase [Anaerolineaceae bacterium]|nr:sensor histidine kinase [Anaerolineaceae bacterium]